MSAFRKLIISVLGSFELCGIFFAVIPLNEPDVAQISADITFCAYIRVVPDVRFRGVGNKFAAIPAIQIVNACRILVDIRDTLGMSMLAGADFCISVTPDSIESGISGIIRCIAGVRACFYLQIAAQPHCAYARS